MAGTKVKDSASSIEHGYLELGVITSEAQLDRKLQAFEQRRKDTESQESLINMVSCTIFGEKIALQRVTGEDGQLKSYNRMPHKMLLLLQFAHKGNNRSGTLKRN